MEVKDENNLVIFPRRFVITERCNANCPHCFNANFRKGNDIDAEKLIRFFIKNDLYFQDYAKLKIRSKIMGGEPLLHPAIKEILIHSVEHYTFSTNVFTNFLNIESILSDNTIQKYIRDDRMTFTVNGFIFNERIFMKVRNNIKSIMVHNVIPLKNHESFIEKVKRILLLSKGQIGIILSPDTQVDIFDCLQVGDYRKIFFHSIKAIMDFINTNKIQTVIQYDHVLPPCFFSRELIDNLIRIRFYNYIRQNSNCCSVNGTLGLVQTNFDLYFCNQTHIKIGSLLDGNREVKDLKELQNDLYSAFALKQRMIGENREECSQCRNLPTCLMGCYYNKYFYK